MVAFMKQRCLELSPLQRATTEVPEVVTDPECQSRLRRDSAFFSDPDPESLFISGSSRSLRDPYKSH